MLTVELASSCRPIFAGWMLRHLGYGHFNQILVGNILKMGLTTRTADVITLKESYDALGLKEGCSLSDVRESFITLAKKYHPDGQMPTSDALRFAQVEKAYRVLKQEFAQSPDGSQPQEEDIGTTTDEKIFDINHTAPQHRQFLSYEGVGYGTQSQRQKQYQSYRVSRAVDNVYEHRSKKLETETGNSVVVRNKEEAKKHKMRNAIERLVEDLIQESMSKGEFQNLPGKGKPLPTSLHNPFIDTVTHKLNEVMINNGFLPEWIVLEKEITAERSALRKNLERFRQRLGPVPLTSDETLSWQQFCDSLADDVKLLNSKINKFNLLVPILTKQTVCFLMDREARKALERGKTNLDPTAIREPLGKTEQCQAAMTSEPTDRSLIGLLYHVFHKG